VSHRHLQYFPTILIAVLLCACGEQQLTVAPATNSVAVGQATPTTLGCNQQEVNIDCLTGIQANYEVDLTPIDDGSEPVDPNFLLTQEQMDAIDAIPGDTAPFPSSTMAPMSTTTALPTSTTNAGATTTAPPVVLYRARNGDPARGELVERIYVERNVAAAGLGDLDNDGDGWALVGRTNGAGDNGSLARFWMDGSAPRVSTRHASKGCLTITPTSLAKVSAGQTRLMTEVAQNTANCRTLPPEADADGDGTPDNTQLLYRARNGNPAAGELGARLYIERNRNAAEAQIGISDYDPDNDGWAMVGRTNGAGDNGTYFSIAMNAAQPNVRITHPSKGCITVTPNSLTVVRTGETRLVTITATTPGACS
jgi:hypothetical protein